MLRSNQNPATHFTPPTSSAYNPQYYDWSVGPTPSLQPHHTPIESRSAQDGSTLSTPLQKSSPGPASPAFSDDSVTSSLAGVLNRLEIVNRAGPDEPAPNPVAPEPSTLHEAQGCGEQPPSPPMLLEPEDRASSSFGSETFSRPNPSGSPYSQTNAESLVHSRSSLRSETPEMRRIVHEVCLRPLRTGLKGWIRTLLFQRPLDGARSKRNRATKTSTCALGHRNPDAQQQLSL